MIICIVGPTGVGKTKMSVELAKRYDGFVINADATQVYKELNIGSAKATPAEMDGVIHELIDFVDIKDDYTVYDYQKNLREILDANLDKNIIITGGSGMYLKAGLYNYEFNKEETFDNYEDISNEELLLLANKKDIKHGIHVNNRQRLVRFLNRSSTTLNKNELLYDVLFIGLTTDRDTLYNKINNRVDQMFNDGLLDEVKNLYDFKNESRILNSAIGYKEVISYLDGDISLENAKELIKKKSRNYAKRQYTWLNNQMDVKWFDVDYDNFNVTIQQVKDYVDKNKLGY